MRHKKAKNLCQQCQQCHQCQEPIKNLIMTISENTLRQVKSADLVNIIGQIVKLKRVGNNYVGLCPFHNEKTPSFIVTRGKCYKCFGCGEGGKNAIDFIIKYERVQFVDAVIRVSAMACITIEHENLTGYEKLQNIKPSIKIESEGIHYISDEMIEQNLKAYKKNNLYLFFVQLFSDSRSMEISKKYNIGSSKYFGNGTTFFVQKDIQGNIRQIKVMLFDPVTGKRSKQKSHSPKIIGRDIIGYDKNLIQCFFGEHLLKGNSLPVAVVESEKTACICSVCYPQFLWIATGGKNGCNMLNPYVNRALLRKEIHLFPDVDGSEHWRKIAIGLKQQNFDVFLNDVMASNSEPGSKEDIADLILINRASNGILLNDKDYPVIWDLV
jgi:hypothetical protein